jgi:hypothetical protein
MTGLAMATKSVQKGLGALCPKRLKPRHRAGFSAFGAPLMQVSTLEITMAEVLASTTLTVRFSRITKARLWVASRLLLLAALVAGCNVEIDHAA